MTKTFNFTTKKNNNGTFFHNNTDYSKIIDNIIIADIAKKNDYLFNYKNDTDILASLIGDEPIIINSSNLKADDDFIKATKFLANYKTYKKKYNIPYKYGEMYKLSDGTPIVFYNDEIQIGFDVYSYNDFKNFSFLNNLTTEKKNIIINIFTNGATDININIL